MDLQRGYNSENNFSLRDPLHSQTQGLMSVTAELGRAEEELWSSEID